MPFILIIICFHTKIYFLRHVVVLDDSINACAIVINNISVSCAHTFMLKHFVIDSRSLKDCDHIIVTMFVSTEHGIRIQDIRATESNSKLLAVCTPHIVTLDKLTIVRHIMNDFAGLENCDKATREAVLDFSFNLSLGKLRRMRSQHFVGILKIFRQYGCSIQGNKTHPKYGCVE